MQALRASAAASPQADLLTWSKAGDEKADVLTDWSFQMGTLALYKLHSAVVCSGPRRSDKARSQAIRSLSQENVGRVTDVSALLPEAARAALLKDPHTQATFELMLNWMYMLTSKFSLPTFGGVPQSAPAGGAAPTAARDISDGAASANGEQPPALASSASSAMDYFSTAIFGTPQKAASSSSVVRRLDGAPATPRSGASGARTATVKPEQLPLLWQLADSLSICGLKAALAPLFELSALPSTFVMEAPAFERLKLLVRALELHTEEIVGALCEQLRLPPPPTATNKDPAPLREGMAELAVAASCVDVTRYEPLVACGLLPASDPKRLAELLDKTSLRVGSEAQVHDLLLTHFAAQKTADDVQQALWSVCRFAYLPPKELVALSEVANVPPKWLALACAQRAAATAGTSGPKTSGLEAGQAARLKPRQFYC